MWDVSKSAPVTEEAQQRDFEKIVDRLNQNLKPM